MNRSNVVRKMCGIALMVVGIIAMPVPLVPGLPLVMAGAAMYGSEKPVIQTCRAWLRTGRDWLMRRVPEG